MHADIILVDGSSYLFRAYHALPPLTTRQGQPTGAVRGVISMLKSLLREYPHSTTVVVFDAKGDTFRNELFAEYKANRPPMPDELRQQIEPVHTLVRALGLPLLIIEGVEADDVIGTLATQAASAGKQVLISTSDKDMAQLVNPHVTLVNTMSNTVSDRAGVLEKFGVYPEQIIDYLALMGDKIDNIPGVEKCGPKTAAKWLAEYQSLENLIANADQIGGKIGENLRAALEQLPLAKVLATIKCDVALPFELNDLKQQEPDKAQLTALYQQLEFKSWLQELQTTADGSAAMDTDHADNSSTAINPPAAVHYHCVTDEAELDALVARLTQSALFAFDLETDSLNAMEARIVGCSVSLQAGEAYYLPCGHDYLGAPAQLSYQRILDALTPVLTATTPQKVLQNAKYDMTVLAQAGVTLQGVAYDTMLESYVLDSVASRHNMDELAARHLNHTTTRFEDIAGKGAKQLTFNQIELEPASHYACEDADITLRLHQTLWPQLAAKPRLSQLLQTLEIPLIPILAAMEQRGVLLDQTQLHAQSQRLAQQLAELEREAHRLADSPFNLSSPKQLGDILYSKLNLPVLKKTPKGQPSTAEAVLDELAETCDHPLPKLLLQWRSLNKLKTTYTDKLPQMINPRTGRVHTSYHQAVTATGRLSSSDPNLQNIPVRTEEGRRVRQAFISPPGYQLLAADYSQIELRIMAHLSGDAGLLKAFAAGQDIHRATASEVFDTPLADVSSEQRRSAKAINFGLIYGMSAFGLAKQLNLSRAQAQQYIDLYFARYPGVLQYMENTREQARSAGYVETLFGRRLYLPDIKASNGALRQAAERTAINAPMQGTAADIIKRAMIAVEHGLAREQLDARMIMQVHDELVLEVATDQLDAVSRAVSRWMSEAAELAVPLVVDTGSGDNWDQAH